MNWDFSFSVRLEVVQDSLGLRLPATLSVAGQSIELRVYLDTGAAYCLIPRSIGEQLGLDVEAGETTTLGTGGGPMPGFLHYATLAIGDFIFEDVPICVAKYTEFDRCLLGRAGWLQKVRMNLITYDEALYLDLHDQ